MKMLKKVFGYLSIVAVLTLGLAFLAYPVAVTQVAGLAVAQTTTKWNSLKDIAVGDAQTFGVGLVNNCLWNGASCDRQRGTITGGALVSQATSGTAFFAVQRDNLTTASVNFPFGFTSKKVMVRASIANTADVCLDWLGGTAVCPAANTAGDARLLPGMAVILDDYAQTSLSLIAESGTQSVNITAWF